MLCQDDNPKAKRHPLPFLPDELIFRILLWLPVRSLLLFKSVCKSWKTHISDPQFAKNHLRSISLNPTITHQRLFSSFHYNKRCKILSFPTNPLFENPSKSTTPVVFRMEHRFNILGSCNGLLCLFDIDQGYVKLWNPSVRFESKKSPNLDFYDKHMFYACHGFGYDHVNDKYKVLIISRLSNEKVIKIYTFGGNSWKFIKNFPFRRPNKCQGKFVSGTLNWIIVKRDVSVILSFDLDKEFYNELLLPDNDAVKACNPVIGVLTNCLCVCFGSVAIQWDIWLMKKYGAAESWTRLTTIPFEQLSNHIHHLPFYTEPLFISATTIVLRTLTKFVRYNLDNGCLDDCLLLDSNKKHIYYESTLVSPQF